MEALAHAPLFRFIHNINFDEIFVLKDEIFDDEDWVTTVFPPYLNDAVGSVDIDINIARVKKRIGLFLQAGTLFPTRMNGKSRVFFILNFLCDGNTEHILLLAVNVKVFGLVAICNFINLVEVFIRIGILLSLSLESSN